MGLAVAHTQQAIGQYLRPPIGENINQLASEGKGIILISSELPEILGVCDRIYVMRDGKIVGEMPASEASQEIIMTRIMTEQMTEQEVTQ